MAIPQAKEMAKIIKPLGNLLLSERLIDASGVYAFSEAVRWLNSQNRSQDWKYDVSISSPIVFRPTETRELGQIVPRVYAKIGVRSTNSYLFESLNSVLEIVDIAGRHISRWHIDLANTDGDAIQAGPLFHLQFGGAWSSSFEEEQNFSLRRPRWNIMPLDIVLMCEHVVSNFYPEQWENLKKNPTWTDSIRKSQKLCFSPFREKMDNNFNVGRETLLQTMWANEWGKA